MSKAPVVLTVSKDTPHVEGTVVLESIPEATVRVTSVDGAAISHAILVGGQTVLPLISSGLYSAQGVAPGVRLTVAAPGFVPYCRFVRRTDLPSISVTLTPATQTARFRFRPTLEPGEVPGYISGLPGNECPVALFQFSLVSRNDADGGTTFTIGVLPQGEFQFSPTAEMPPRPLLVPGPGLSFSRGPRPQQ